MEWNFIHPSFDNAIILVKTASDTMNIPAEINRLEKKNDLQYLQIPGQNLFHQNCPSWKPRPIVIGIKDIANYA